MTVSVERCFRLEDHPELQTRVYGTPVMNILGGEKNAERYRNEYDPISVFDRPAKSTPYTPDLLKAPAMTHQYANNAQHFKPD